MEEKIKRMIELEAEAFGYMVSRFGGNATDYLEESESEEYKKLFYEVNGFCCNCGEDKCKCEVE